MGINLMDILGVSYDEKVISNLLVGLINNSKNFRNAFSKEILEIENPWNYEVNSYAKMATSKGIPDIIVTAENNEEFIVVITEAKVKSNEGRNQILVYNEEEIKELFIKPSNKDKRFTYKYVYLSMVKSKDGIVGVLSKTFRELVEKVWVEIEDRGLERLYLDFCSNVTKQYSIIDAPKGNMNLLKILSSEGRDKINILFRQIILSQEYSNDLYIDFFTTNKEIHDIIFLSKYMKKEWVGKEASYNNGKYNIGADTYDIHIEVELQRDRKKLLMYLHYEPNPYITRGRLINVAREEDIESFENKRNSVIDQISLEVTKLQDEYIKSHLGVNTIAYVEYDLREETTVGEFNQVCTYYLEILSGMIDKALERK